MRQHLGDMQECQNLPGPLYLMDHLAAECQELPQSPPGCDVPRGFPDESPSSEVITVESRTQLDQAVTDTVNQVLEERQQGTQLGGLAWKWAERCVLIRKSEGGHGGEMDRILKGSLRKCLDKAENCFENKSKTKPKKQIINNPVGYPSCIGPCFFFFF